MGTAKIKQTVCFVPIRGSKMKNLILSIIAICVLLSGCASFNVSKEALERADRALEQAELANQRIDKLMH